MDLKRLNVIIGYDKLTLEEKVRRAVRAAKLEMTSQSINAMRELPPSVKLARSSDLFTFAIDQLCAQEQRTGFDVAIAQVRAAQRMLNANDW